MVWRTVGTKAGALAGEHSTLYKCWFWSMFETSKSILHIDEMMLEADYLVERKQSWLHMKVVIREGYEEIEIELHLLRRKNFVSWTYLRTHTSIKSRLSWLCGCILCTNLRLNIWIRISFETSCCVVEACNHYRIHWSLREYTVCKTFRGLVQSDNDLFTLANIVLLEIIILVAACLEYFEIHMNSVFKFEGIVSKDWESRV